MIISLAVNRELREHQRELLCLPCCCEYRGDRIRHESQRFHFLLHLIMLLKQTLNRWTTWLDHVLP